MLARRGSLLRNSVAGAVATGLDFMTVWALVTATVVSVPVATLLGSIIGAVTNFWINRTWAFGSNLGYARQVFRYAAVSGGSALINAGLVAVLLALWDGGYAAVWVVVRVAVFVGWNYPLHRHYVFVRAPEAPTAPA